MPLDNRKNFAKGTLSTGYDAVAVSIVLQSGQGARFAAPSFNCVWWNVTDYGDPGDDPNVEIVRVTGVTGDTLTVTRAQEGTSASVKNLAGKTYRILAGITKKSFDDLDARTAVVQTAYAAAINTDASQGSTFEVGSMTGNLIIANPTNGADGQVVSWILPQDSTGGRTITLGSKFKIPTSATSPLAFSTAASATDLLTAKYRLSTDRWVIVALVPGV